MVMMSDDLWSKIMDNLVWDDRDGLGERIDAEVMNMPNDTVKYIMAVVKDDYDDCCNQIAHEMMQKVQDRPHIRGLQNCRDFDNEMWIALNACIDKED